MASPVSNPLNARVSAVALVVGASSQMAAGLSGQLAAPWAFAGWLVFVIGAVGLCHELGASRPLNRAGLVCLAAAFCARAMLIFSSDPAVDVRSVLLFAFGMMAAILLWSVALMHRSDWPRLVGAIGTLLSGSALLLLLTAHILVGGVALFGFSDLFRALHHSDTGTGRATASLSLIMALWSLVTAFLLWTRGVSLSAGRVDEPAADGGR
jgi:hypothetical protein